MKIAVFYGGRSVEHEVSIQSAVNVVEGIKRIKGFEPLCFFVDKSGRWYFTDDKVSLSKQKPVVYDFSNRKFIVKGRGINIDVCFSLIHGNEGEDGKLQSFFEIALLPYTGCDVLASALSMNKKLSKVIAERAGVSVLDDIFINKDNFEFKKIEKEVKRLGFPVFVKPNSLGSSVGVSKVKGMDGLEDAIKNAFRYDSNILIEKGVEKAREIVVGVIGDGVKNNLSVPGEVKVKGRHEFYDYNAKYVDDDGMELLIPSPLNSNLSEELKKSAEIVFKSVGGYGFARVDFLMDPLTQKFYFCEINTIPGFTSHSLFPRLFAYSGFSLEKQIKIIVDLAVKRYNSKNNLRYEI